VGFFTASLASYAKTSENLFRISLR